MNDWEQRSECYLWEMGRVKHALSVLESAAWWSLCSSGLSFRPLMVRRATFDRINAGLYGRTSRYPGRIFNVRLMLGFRLIFLMSKP